MRAAGKIERSEPRHIPPQKSVNNEVGIQGASSPSDLVVDPDRAREVAATSGRFQTAIRSAQAELTAWERGDLDGSFGTLRLMRDIYQQREALLQSRSGVERASTRALGDPEK